MCSNLIKIKSSYLQHSVIIDIIIYIKMNYLVFDILLMIILVKSGWSTKNYKYINNKINSC